MLRVLTVLVLSMLSGAGLAAPGGAEQARPPAETELPSRAATVRWIPRSSAAGEIALTARIEFARALGSGDLSVTVPSGLRLIEGPVALKVAASPDLSPVEVAYRFALDGPVSADLVVSFDAGGTHTEAAWRPAPGPRAPADDGKIPPRERGARN
jgi:hypothetical protein